MKRKPGIMAAALLIFAAGSLFARETVTLRDG